MGDHAENMTKKPPRVSILIPVYNTADYLKECLDSVLKQTLREIEVICVDDGSTDGSAAILRAYAAKDKRVKILTQSNRGLPAARNAGLDAARGEYVGFVDSDDKVLPQMYKKLLRAAKKNKADVVVCGATVFPRFPAPGKWLASVLTPRDKVYDGFTPDLLFKERGARPFLWRDLVRRDLIERNGLRLDENVVVGEDQAFQFKVFPRAGRVAFLSAKLYCYRHARPRSIMACARSDAEYRVKNHVLLVKNAIESLREAGKWEISAKEFFVWCVPFLVKDLVRIRESAKAEVAQRVLALFCLHGLRQKYTVFGAEIAAQAEYLLRCSNAQNRPPKISVLADVWGVADIGAFRRSMEGQTDDAYEVLLLAVESVACRDDVIAYVTEDTRARLITCSEAEGCAWNAGIKEAAGEVLVFCGASDVFTPNAVRKIKEEMSGADAMRDLRVSELRFSSFVVRKRVCVENEIRITEKSRIGAYNFIIKCISSASTVVMGETFYRPVKGLKAILSQGEEAAKIYEETLETAFAAGEAAFCKALSEEMLGDEFRDAVMACEGMRTQTFNALVRLSMKIDACGVNRTGTALLPVCAEIFVE